MPLRRVFSTVTGGSWGSEPGAGDVDALCVRGTDFNFGALRIDLSKAPVRSFTAPEFKLRAAIRGDILIEKSGGGDQQPVGRCVLHDLEAAVMPTNFAGRLRPAEAVSPRFAAYLMASLYFEGRTRACIKQTTGIQNLDLDALLSQRVTMPLLVAQEATANYLDQETTRIDALIAAKRRMIGLLEEKRRVFVSNAVTNGLQPAATRRTNSEFVPIVPAHWELMGLKHVVTRIVDTAHKTAPDVDGGPYLVVRTANVKAGRLVFEDAVYTDEAGYAEWTERAVPRAGDILFTREAPAGEACLVPEGVPLCIGQRMVLIQVDASLMLGEFGMYSLYGGAAQEFIRLLVRSTTVAHLNMSDIPNIPIALPPVEEQRTIVYSIRQEAERIDRLLEAIRAQIRLLGDRRQAVITAAITGAVEIPGVAA